MTLKIAVHLWSTSPIQISARRKRCWCGDVRFLGTGSTGRRNTGVKSLWWGFKLQGLTWSFVELSGHEAPVPIDEKAKPVATGSACQVAAPQ